MDWALFWAGLSGVTGLFTVSSGVVIFMLRSHTARLETKIDAAGSYSESYTDAKVAQAIAQLQRDIADLVRQQIELAIDAKLNKLSNEISLRINGTYMRTPEAVAHFDNLQRQINSLAKQ
jgi:hypothetical protein